MAAKPLKVASALHLATGAVLPCATTAVAAGDYTSRQSKISGTHETRCGLRRVVQDCDRCGWCSKVERTRRSVARYEGHCETSNFGCAQPSSLQPASSGREGPLEESQTADPTSCGLRVFCSRRLADRSHASTDHHVLPMQLSRAARRPITGGLAEGACPLLEALPRRSSSSHHYNAALSRLVFWRSPQEPRSTLSASASCARFPLEHHTLLSPLSTLSSSVLFPAFTVLVNSAQPGVFLSIDHDTPLHLI
ncbi:hypothetical protein SVAN01_02549 [Stagonosporopsis vannaccii]|nr:hypothetical protein SVAN01_02549 [Stagonosporopsis vannaccii]